MKHKFVKRRSDEGNNDHEIRQKHVAKYLTIKQVHTIYTIKGLTPNTSWIGDGKK